MLRFCSLKWQTRVITYIDEKIYNSYPFYLLALNSILRPYQPNHRNRHIPYCNKQLPYQDKTADQCADCDIETAHCDPHPQIAKEHWQQEHKPYAKGDPAQHKQVDIIYCPILHGKLKEQVV